MRFVQGEVTPVKKVELYTYPCIKGLTCNVTFGRLKSLNYDFAGLCQLVKCASVINFVLLTWHKLKQINAE